MELRFEVECDFNIGDTVMVEQEGAFLGLPITAIIIEIRGEVNVHYELHGHDAELDYSLVIECTVIGIFSPADSDPGRGHECLLPCPSRGL
ncbi:MAG: hypothetical protein GXX09_05965 [Syntrophomonadaceae bacterium]|nr:hypothetical protein [Syntrophomonadaceae bacterium]